MRISNLVSKVKGLYSNKMLTQFIIQSQQLNMFKRCIGQIDPKKARQMCLGATGIYVIFLLLGIVYEKITKTSYFNRQTNQYDPFRITSGLIAVQRTINYLLGKVYMHFTVPKHQQVVIPHKNSAIVGGLIWLSSITQTESMYLVSFPLIIMTKSCNLISVILVGVLCSRVTSKELKLGPKKILIAIIVSVGCVSFRVFDPAASFEDGKSTEIIGLVLLLVSLLADGFIPDFQAEIKDKYKPSPIQMLITINKWCGIFSTVSLIVLWQLQDFIVYCYNHLQFSLDLLIISVFSFVGQLFIYRMIKQFKQHIVPFIITTRKIVSVGLSIVYFKHDTSVGQVLAILVVLSVMMYEFLGNVEKKEYDKEAKSTVELVEEIGEPSGKGKYQSVSKKQTNQM